MKKITAILMVVIVMTALALPVLAESAERQIIVVGSISDLPEANAESPDFVFVQDESIVYVKYVDPVTGEIKYIPESELTDYGYVVTPEQTWVKGTKDEGTTFTSTAPFDKLIDVYVDSVLVAKEYYTASGTSTTVITLTPEYLETLAVGDHTITVLSNDGSGSCPFHIQEKQTPAPDNRSSQTGDTSNTGMWAAIALITLGAIGVVALTLVKNRKSTEK